ncbi:MAG: tRNA (adenosine(37)-N6)-dimethylallyltransferase MiaA [bacterium]|nr:tRNA (adenosine(37)-N6)-dimethylallyltransferase MiaA [bacterium]
MKQDQKKEALALAGPTAVGKTAVGLVLAQKLKAHVISADSRQIYKYLEIGTAKPTADELAKAPHHMVGILTPDLPYSAAAFAAEARRVMDELDEISQTYIIVGGSGLYLKALTEGLVDIPAADPTIRQELKEFSQAKGNQALLQRLAECDPETAQRLSANDEVRIIRALEIFMLTGKPLSLWFQEKRQGDNRNYKLIVMDLDRKTLYQRIEARVDGMMAQGLLDEVKNLMERGYGPDSPGMQTVGYQELMAHLSGKTDMAEAIRLIKRNTRHYAKRQLTWFRKMNYQQWITCLPEDNPEDIVNKILV